MEKQAQIDSYLRKIRFIKISDLNIINPKGRKTISSRKRISAVAIIAFALMGTALTYSIAGLLTLQKALLPENETLPSSGNIAALDLSVYADSNCSQVLESINWGTIMPGDNVTKEIKIKNTGNTPIILNMTTTDWKPKKVDQQIAITWDKEGKVLNPHEMVRATLRLTVAENATTINDFTVTIEIKPS
jgi:hypothetical protein